MENVQLRRLLLIATVTALLVTALLAIAALLAGDFSDTDLRILATTAGFGLVSLIATRGTALLEQSRKDPLGRAVVAVAAIAFLAELWAVWFDSDNEAAWKSYVCVIALAGALGQIAGMIARRRPNDPPSLAGLVWGAGACAVVLTLMAWFAALTEPDDAGFYQLFGVVAILDILAVVLQPVVRRLGRPARTAAVDGFVVVLRNGRRVEHGKSDDLPDAVARALREYGAEVARIELRDG